MVKKVSRSKLVLMTAENQKLGIGVPVFNLPAGKTCPGKSQWCYEDGNCYALKLEKIRPSVRTRYARNLEWIESNGLDKFVEQIKKEIGLLDPKILRIHADGDFFSAPYTLAWARIARETPHVSFWAYTRSWRVPDVRGALEELRALPNVQLFASWDPTMDAKPPVGWRLAAVPQMPEGFKAMTCLVQIKDKSGSKVRDSCASCGFCVNAPVAGAGNVRFVKH